ncbi:hypothetical protein ACQZ45_18945 [Agrobacterium sp. 16-2014-1-2a]
MRDIDDLISGLIRAANDPARMAPEDHSGLLYQAILAITDLRRQAGFPPTGTSRDGIIQLRAVAGQQEDIDPSERAAAQLEAADMITTLRVVIKSGVSTRIFEHGAAD